MSSSEAAADCYTHSREFTHEECRFRVRINDDRMTYTTTASREGSVVARVTDLDPETASASPARLAERLLD